MFDSFAIDEQQPNFKLTRAVKIDNAYAPAFSSPFGKPANFS
ncbi:hypothetical protein GM298_18680 [Enterobacter sp. HSTU-ASh6]|nr:hypothetical protein [Enterobacter sp. HSTU-ASh6]